MRLRYLLYQRTETITTIGFFVLYMLMSTVFAQTPPPPPNVPNFVTPPDCTISPKPGGCVCVGNSECASGKCQAGLCTAPPSPPPSGSISNPIQAKTFGELVQAIAKAITAIGIPLVAIFLVWSGFLFVTARGNEQQLVRAKTTFFWALVGGAVVIGAWAIATAIVNFARSLG